MEEVDTIIVRQLKAIDCEIDEDKISLKDLDMNEIINCASRCLLLIRNSIESDSHSNSYISINSNSNMATKYKVANELSTQIKSLGYRIGSKSSIGDSSTKNDKITPNGSELGYQTFLYGSHSEFRNLFLFLISKLPKDSSEQDVPSSWTFDQILKDRIKKNVVEQVTWMPFMTSDTEQPHDSQQVYCKKLSHIIWNQRWHEYGLFKNEKQMDIPQLVKKEDDMKQGSMESTSRVSKELDESLEEQLKLLEEKSRRKQQEISDKKSTLDQSTQLLKTEQLELIELKHSDISIESLKGAINVLNQDLNTLKEKWTELESELSSEKNQIVKEIKSKSSERDIINEKLKLIKNQTRENLIEVKDKELLLESLQSNIPKKSVPTRKSYTKRILEIISNYKKQMIQTQNILMDIKGHQKEINTLSGKVSRSFTICDDMIFKSVTSKGEKLDYRVDGDFHKKSYKLLASLHEMNDYITSGLESIGSIKRDILKTEQLIEKEEADKIDDKLDKITKDLSQIKGMNDELISKMNNS